MNRNCYRAECGGRVKFFIRRKSADTLYRNLAKKNMTRLEVKITNMKTGEEDVVVYEVPTENT